MKIPIFLLQALTHASYTLNKITESCERLEFLGDAVLDYLITVYLVTKNRDLTPGQITDMRSALVNNNTLADIAVRNGLHKHLLQQSPELFRRYLQFQIIFFLYVNSNTEEVRRDDLFYPNSITFNWSESY